jgi:hypothetical protein
MDFVRSVDLSSDAISLQFLRVFVPSEANCSARKRSPLRVQRRIITRGPVAEGQTTAVPGVVFAGLSSQIADSLDTAPINTVAVGRRTTRACTRHNRIRRAPASHS